MDDPSIQNTNGTKQWIEKHMKILSDKSGIPAPIITGILIICCVCVFVGFFDKYITLLVAVIYPSYWSIKAIESEEKDDDKQWLTYWVVFAVFTVFDTIGAPILHYIPFYFFIKIIFLIWCFLPNTRGALFIYEKFLIGCFKKYEAKLDKINHDFEDKFTSVYSRGKDYTNQNKGRIVQAGFDISNKFSNS